MLNLTENFIMNRNQLDGYLKIDKSFDIVGREIKIDNLNGKLYFVDGFIKDDIMQRVIEFLLSAKNTHSNIIEEFSNHLINYTEVNYDNDIEKISVHILSGVICLIVENYDKAILIDARTYPARSIEEPGDEKVLRGSRDGFTEVLVFNTAMIRRRIRNPNLTFEIFSIGDVSKTDVVISYMENKVNKKLLKEVQNKLKNLKVENLVMSQESLVEELVAKQWYNPFPKVRYTERPDSASAHVLEGKILIIVDNSPAVIILPTTFFDFTQDVNDYYFPPLVGTYLKFVRTVIFLSTLFVTPIWYLLIKNPQYIPSSLEFIKVSEPNQVPIIVQLLIIEFIIDGLKLASLNTPSTLNNSFSVVGALLLGDFAVNARWFVPEVVLYMAFIATSTFTQPSFELGYSFILSRIMLLLLIASFNIWGFVVGMIIILTVISTTKTITKTSYLYPLFPFNKKAMMDLIIRRPKTKV